MIEINVLNIIVDNYKTFVNLHGRIDGALCFIFILLPLAIGGCSNFIEVNLKESLGDLIKYVAFFGAFLFNLLALMYNLRDNVRNKKEIIDKDSELSSRERKKEARKQKYKLIYATQIHANISYSILVAIILVLTLVSYQSIPFLSKNDILNPIYKTTIITLVIHYTLFLIMILKKVYVIMEYN